MKTVLVTGGTSGIGLLVVQKLARRGDRVVMLARNEDKARSIRQDIWKRSPTAMIDIVYADFSRLRTVADAAKLIESKFSSVDILINNAGIHAFHQRVTEDGYAEMLSVNYLAPWLLTHKLAPLLASAPCSRVVTVASEASRHGGRVNPDVDLTDVSDFSWRKSMALYGKTKLMNIMFSRHLAYRMQTSCVASICLDPGFNATGLGRELPFSGTLLALLKAAGIGNPDRGADIITRLATDPSYTAFSGSYFSRRAELISPSGQMADFAAQSDLWASTETLLHTFI